jgi:hypothetical protein
METMINAIGPVGAAAPRRPEIPPPTRDAPASDPPPAPAPPKRVDPDRHVDLAAWFDRNGDGRIDTNTWVNGGDAYLRVDKDMSALLDHTNVRAHERRATAAHEAATDAYRRYGNTAPENGAATR